MARGARGGGDRSRTPVSDLNSCHSELRRAIDALNVTTRNPRAVGDEIDGGARRAGRSAGRAVVSARSPAIGLDHDWTVDIGVSTQPTETVPPRYG